MGWPGSPSRSACAGRRRWAPCRVVLRRAPETARDALAPFERNASSHEKSLRQRRGGARRPDQGRHDLDGGRIRPLRRPRDADRGGAQIGREGSDLRLQQRRRRRGGPWNPARDRPDQEDDLKLRRREQDLRQSLSFGQARARIQSAGHPGRAHPRRRRRDSRLLHPHGRGHDGRRGQGNPRLQQRGLCDGELASSPTSLWFTPGKATPKATSSIGKRRAISIR